MLTDTKLRNLKPQEKLYKVNDRDGLYVAVTTAGAISFRYNYSVNGRQETVTFGRYGSGGITLAEAREQLGEAKKLLAAGKSPAKEKARDKARIKDAVTFDAWAEKWLRGYQMADSTRDMRRSVYERELKPKFGNQKLVEITHEDLRALTDAIVERGAPAMRQAATWSELHSRLAEYGLQIKLRGAGFVIGDAGLGLWCKASECGRDLSMKALTDRRGPFERYKNMTSHEARKRYEPRPRQPHSSSAALFAEYQRERQAAIVGRKLGFAAIKTERAQEGERIRKWATTQRAIIKAGPRGPVKKMLYANVQAQAVAARRTNAAGAAAKSKALSGGAALPNWNEWLMQRAEAGDVDALVVLRSRAERAERMRGDLLSAKRAERAKAAIMESLKPQARKDGTMAYRTADGGLVLDRASHVQAATATVGAALVALSLAADRFEGQALDVRGTEQFRRDVAQLAAMHKICVTFADSAMEMTRRAAEAVQQAKPFAVGAATSALPKGRGRVNTKGTGIEL